MEMVHSQFVGREADAVDGRLVVGIFVHLGPLLCLRLLPYANLAIIGARSQKAAKLGMRPCHLPHWPFVRRELGTQLVLCLVRRDVEDLRYTTLDVRSTIEAKSTNIGFKTIICIP